MAEGGRARGGASREVWEGGGVERWGGRERGGGTNKYCFSC